MILLTAFPVAREVQNFRFEATGNRKEEKKLYLIASETAVLSIPDDIINQK